MPKYNLIVSMPENCYKELCLFAESIDFLPADAASIALSILFNPNYYVKENMKNEN